tara:strand:- start:740 stop:1351 length:612 start_codon:yes stop_codon:yes gene_type:complete
MNKNIDILGCLFIVLVLILSFNLYHYSDGLQLVCVISDVDGNRYCVRDDQKVKESADLLASVTTKCKTLVSHLKNKYNESDDRVNRLVKNFDPKKVYEILPTSSYTAYSENKGEKLAFCLNTTKKGNEAIDENTLTFVALHELSHIASKSIGHTEEFWRNFKFLLHEAEEINIYNVVDYSKRQVNYCGMKITSNPYFRKDKKE